MKAADKQSALQVTKKCLAGKMKTVDRIITKIYDDAMRPHGLRVTQFYLLAHAIRNDCFRQADVCAALQINDSTMSRNIQRMKANGWLENVESEDKRETLFQITSLGLQTFRKAEKAWKKAQKQTDELVGDPIVEAFSRLTN